MKLREFSTNGLVGYWKMDEGVGATAYDKTDNNNDGTITGATWVAGKTLGRALDFDGTDDNVLITHNAVFNITARITVEAWIYPETWGASSLGTILGKALSGFMFALRSDAGQDNLRFYANSALIDNSSVAGSVSLNAWQHVVITYDRVSKKFYIDGALNRETAETDAIGTNTSDLYIGERDSFLIREFDGRIDEVKLYNRALSATEVSRHYAAGNFIIPEKNVGFGV